jgi:hypothetical protein
VKRKDEMQRAMEIRAPYETRLAPPPADERVAHEAREKAEHRSIVPDTTGRWRGM